MKNLLKIVNPESTSLGEMLGIPMERQNEISKKLDEMGSEAETGVERAVYMSEEIQIMASFCNNIEELFYAYANHLAWLMRTGKVPVETGVLHIKRSYCFDCGLMTDHIKGYNTAPRPGMVTVCPQCGGVQMLSKNFELVECPQEHLIAMREQAPNAWQQLQEAIARVKQQARHKEN